MRAIVRWAVLLSFAASGAVARAEDPAKPAGERRRVLERVVEILGYRDRVRAALRDLLGDDPALRTEKFWAAVDWAPLTDHFVDEFATRFDEPTAASMLAALESEEGKRWALLRRVERADAEISAPLVQVEARRDRGVKGDEERLHNAMQAAFSRALEVARPRMKADSNETAAIATLRHLAAAQAQCQTMGKIDCDHDGIGEFGTFLEMAGVVGVRKGFLPGAAPDRASADFGKIGRAMSPPVLAPALGGVDASGIVTKAGYCFRIFLPDSRDPAGFVHETGPKVPGLAGGSGRIGVDLAETHWCAYAWPIVNGQSGTRVFFVNQMGDVLQSSNERAGWSGTGKPVEPASAFLGAGATSTIAIGTQGRDGDLWRVTN
jgi:hypothetical protein